MLTSTSKLFFNSIAEVQKTAVVMAEERSAANTVVRTKGNTFTLENTPKNSRLTRLSAPTKKCSSFASPIRQVVPVLPSVLDTAPLAELLTAASKKSTLISTLDPISNQANDSIVPKEDVAKSANLRQTENSSDSDIIATNEASVDAKPSVSSKLLAALERGKGGKRNADGISKIARPTFAGKNKSAGKSKVAIESSNDPWSATSM